VFNLVVLKQTKHVFQKEQLF